VFTALASTSYADQSHAYTFSIASIPKCSKTHLRKSLSLIRKIFPGVISPDPRSKGKGMGREEEGEREWKGKEGERDGRE
jgi:hypothetical protein